MKIKITKLSGFCAGVNNAVEKTKEELIINKPLYCLGEIVHNESVVKELKNLGLIVINDISESPENAKVIIRAHGEPLSTYEKAKKKNISLIDLTCGKVSLIHKKILNNRESSFIVIIGKKQHPEIIGDIGYCNNNYYIVEDEDDIPDLIKNIKKTKLTKIYIVSQTTFSNNKFDELVKKIKSSLSGYEITIDKTICNVTENHQKEVSDLSKIVDKMIVIGGKNSSNTKELAKISQKNCEKTYLISEPNELNIKDFNKDDVIGIAAGASTPYNLVLEIEKKLKYNLKER